MKTEPHTTPDSARPLPLDTSYRSYLTYSSYLRSSRHKPFSSAKTSQGATYFGPLKFSWPPEAHEPQQTRDIDSKTKDAQMLTEKVSTFEKSERLSFLTQYQSSRYISPQGRTTLSPPQHSVLSTSSRER